MATFTVEGWPSPQSINAVRVSPRSLVVNWPVKVTVPFSLMAVVFSRRPVMTDWGLLVGLENACVMLWFEEPLSGTRRDKAAGWRTVVKRVRFSRISRHKRGQMRFLARETMRGLLRCR